MHGFFKIMIPALVILFGLWLLLKDILPVSISFFRILVGILIIAFGISVLVGGFHYKGAAVNRSSGSHDIVFSNAVIEIDPEAMNGKEININCVFGAATVILPKDASYTIHTSGAFCSMKTPDGHVVTFGENYFNSKPEQNTGTRHIKIESSCAFGSIQFKWKE